MTSSGCSNGCLTYQPKSGLTSINFAARLASTEGVSSSEASNLRREIDVALKDLKGFDKQISLLRLSILVLQHKRAAFEERVADSKALLSPIRRLPVEMLTEILSHCCAPNKVAVIKRKDHDQGKLTIDAPATTLRKVCRSWNLTVESTKALWACIRLDIQAKMNDKDSERVQRAISCILQASGEAPLDVTIKTVSFHGKLHSSVHSLISEAKRWQFASLAFLHSDGGQLWQGLKGNLPILERLKLELQWQYNNRTYEFDMFSQVPRLGNIALRDVELGSSVSLPYSQMRVIQLRNSYLRDTLDILQQASSLDHLTLYDPRTGSNGADKTVHAITATSFRMNWENHESKCVKDHLACWSFPVLEEFHLDDRNVKESTQDKFQVGTQLLSYLAPSSRTLHVLTLERVTMHSDDLIDLLIMLPRLTTLRLLKENAKEVVTPKVIQRLHGYGSRRAERVLLPKLVNLEIDLVGVKIFSSLLAMVESRLVRDSECSFVGLQKVSLWVRDERFDEVLHSDVMDLSTGGMIVSIRDSKGFVDYKYKYS